MIKKLITGSLLVIASLSLSAQNSEEKIEFSVVKQNPITSVKNQSRSGTCWCYATLGFFEAEVLRKTGQVVDLCEMFVVNKDYLDCARYHVRQHGDSRFSEGGSADDALTVMMKHGICPEEAMPKPGSLTGDSLANFTEFFSLLEPYVAAVAKTDRKKLSPQWQVAMQKIIDAYVGECPAEFVYNGKGYTPQSFAASLGLDFNEYVSITSFTHHPFYENFIIEAPYKWRPQMSLNVPLDEMMLLIDDALDQGFTICWGGDVSGNGFTRNGLADTPDKRTPSQESRQQRFDQWDATYDHVMLIYGKALSPEGRPFYMVKNSWGETGLYKGIWFMSRDYIAVNTTYIFLNRNALPESLARLCKRID